MCEEGHEGGVEGSEDEGSGGVLVAVGREGGDGAEEG